MTDTIRWRPPLPSVGRLGGAPVTVPLRHSLLEKLKEFYTDRRSVADFFEVRIQPETQFRVGLGRGIPRYLSEFSPSEQVHLILSSLYYKASDNFKLKLRLALRKKGGLNHIRQWFHTANAAVLPYLITQGEDLVLIDRLTRWALENCANNYAQFQRDWKSLKKAMRKAFALNRGCSVHRSMRTYYEVFRRVRDFDSPQSWGRYVLCWTQTRATGLADRKMITASVEKFSITVTTPIKRVVLNPDVLDQTVRGTVKYLSSNDARISVGPTSCMESTRKEGGKTFFLRRLCLARPVDHRPLRFKYDFKTLEATKLPTRRRIRSSEDVLHWSVQYALHNPCAIRCIRVHTVAEPGKARTITVAPYAYQTIMGVFAHVFQATLKSKGVSSGLTKDRHLWRFLTDTMNPQSTMWENLIPGERVWGLSSDLSEATDYGNPMVARQVWLAFIRLAMLRPEFPTALAVLAMNLYCGKRYCFVPHRGGYKLLVTTRGWFMGDMMTKVILTVVHDYTMRIVGLKVYSLVGDDEVALSNSRRQLTAHLDALGDVDLKVSREDTYVSRRLIFYCEEGSLVPQSPVQALHVSMRRQVELGYLDYPRLRLCLAERSETDSYSMTNVGRFSLLGKESRWVYNTNRRAAQYFEIASLLQHILVPQDSDTLCPFTPLEMGGDGGFISDPSFLNKVVQDKCRCPREALYRMHSLMNNAFNFRFVRSSRKNEVIHKHHFMVPVYEKLAEGLGDAVLRPKDAQMSTLLSSLKIKGLERPEVTWLRLCRGFYYRSIFDGRLSILEPKFEKDIQFSLGKTKDPDVNVDNFIRHWANPGFRFSTPNQYWVRRDAVEELDPLHLPWDWSSTDPDRYPSALSVFSNWLRDEVDITESSFEDVYNLLKHQDRLPDRVAKRLNLFMESDSYILSTLPKDYREQFGLVTRDFNLAAEVRKRLKKGSLETIVYCLDPAAYLTGMFYIKPPMWFNCRPYDGDWVEDPGSILHSDYTEFTDGYPHDWGITGIDRQDGTYDPGYPLIARFHQRHTGVVVISFQKK